MPDLLARGAAWLRDRQGESVATPVVYTRGDGNLGVLYATIGQTTREQQVEDGLVNVARRIDIIVSVNEFLMQFGGEPKEGDQVGLHEKTWRVRPFGGEPGWRYSDQHYKRFRIHLVEVCE